MNEEKWLSVRDPIDNTKSPKAGNDGSPRRRKTKAANRTSGEIMKEYFQNSWSKLGEFCQTSHNQRVQS